MNNHWTSLPTWIRSILIGFVLLIPIVTVIQLLIFENVISFPQFPWSALITFILLGLYWQLISGKQYPFGKSAFRKKYSGTKTIEGPNQFSDKCKIGISLLMFVFSVTSLGFAFSGIEETVQYQTIKQIGTAPIQTAITLYFALSLTAGIMEEVVFRGYVQGMMIEKYGIKISFLFVAIIFTLIHFLPPVLYLPYFLISIALSWVAYVTSSIIIGVIAHATFDFIAFLFVYFDALYISEQHLNTNLSLHVLIAIVTSLLLGYQGRKILSQGKQKEIKSI